MCIRMFSHVWVFVTLWTITCQASLFIGFSRQDYWNGLPCFPPGDLPNPKDWTVSPVFLAFQADSLSTELPGKSYCWISYSIFQCLQFLLHFAPSLEVFLKIFFVSSWWISPLLILKYPLSVLVFSYFKVYFLIIRLPHQFFLGKKSRTYI